MKDKKFIAWVQIMANICDDKNYSRNRILNPKTLSAFLLYSKTLQPFL